MSTDPIRRTVRPDGGPVLVEVREVEPDPTAPADGESLTGGGWSPSTRVEPTGAAVPDGPGPAEPDRTTARRRWWSLPAR